jgi:hypothetical protein
MGPKAEFPQIRQARPQKQHRTASHERERSVLPFAGAAGTPLFSENTAAFFQAKILSPAIARPVAHLPQTLLLLLGVFLVVSYKAALASFSTLGSEKAESFRICGKTFRP